MAHHWRVDADRNFYGVGIDLLGVIFHWALGLELTNMTFTNKEYEDARRLQMAWHQHLGWAKPAGKYSIKHPVLVAALIFYVIGFLIGYGVGKI